MLMGQTGIAGFVAAAGISRQFIGGATSTANSSSYNFGDFVIPSAGLVVVAFAARDVSTSIELTSLSIGGTNGTIQVKCIASGRNEAAIVTRRLTAGATVNVTANLSGNPNHAGVAVYLLTGDTSDTAHDTANDQTGGTDVSSISNTLDLPANGITFFSGCTCDSDGSNYSSATKDYSARATGENFYIDAGTLVSASAVASHIETLSRPAGADRMALASASFA